MCFYRDDVVLILKQSFDQEKFLMNDYRSMLFIDIRGDNCVRYSSFIFKAEEKKTFCSSGPLSGDHAACYLGESSVRQQF